MQGTFDFYQQARDRPKKPERLFFGLFPDAATSRGVTEFGERFASAHRLPGKALRPERLHVSLHHVGDYKRLRSKFVYAAQHAGRAVLQRPVEVAFRFIETFAPPPVASGAGQHPLVLRGEGGALFELHAMLGAAMRKYGFKPADAFVPHMTLLYGPRAVPLQPIAPIQFVAREFLLIHSEVGLSRYTVLGRWPLLG